MYRAMYERKYKISADNLRDEDLAEFIWQYVSFHPPSNKAPYYLPLDLLPLVAKSTPPRRKLPPRLRMPLNRLSPLLRPALRILL